MIVLNKENILSIHNMLIQLCGSKQYAYAIDELTFMLLWRKHKHGILAIFTFIQLNGIEIDCSDKELVKSGIHAAAGGMAQKKILIWTFTVISTSLEE